MKITMDGKYQTRDGRPVRILATDMKGVNVTVIGLVCGQGGQECPLCWTADGHFGTTESNLDLVPVPPAKCEGWVVMSDEGWLYGQYVQTDPSQTERIFANEHRRHIFWEE